MADNGMNRMPDSGLPNSSINPDPLSFQQIPNDGGAIINGNGTMLSNNSALPPFPNSSSNTLTSTTTGFHENGVNHAAPVQPQSHFIHGKHDYITFCWEKLRSPKLDDMQCFRNDIKYDTCNCNMKLSYKNRKRKYISVYVSAFSPQTLIAECFRDTKYVIGMIFPPHKCHFLLKYNVRAK